MIVIQSRQTVFSSLLHHFRFSLSLDLLISLIFVKHWLLHEPVSAFLEQSQHYQSPVDLAFENVLLQTSLIDFLYEGGMLTTHAYSETMILTRCLLFLISINDLIFLRWHLHSTRLLQFIYYQCNYLSQWLLLILDKLAWDWIYIFNLSRNCWTHS